MDFQHQLTSPTPIASTVWSLTLLAALGLVYVLYSTLRRSQLPSNSPHTTWDKLIGAVRSVDRAIITYGSLVIGTHYHRRWVRRLVLIAYFTALALVGAFAPWPWGLLPIALGVFSIFIVFRHWSVDEDERFDEVPFESKKIPIQGDLNVEVVIACAFLFVYAPSAFAQLQANGYGFQMSPRAGPFTFVIYTLLETVKAGSLVDYYDLYAERLGFEKYAGAHNPTPWAKWAVIAYRLSLNLLLLAALKRLLDIARRMADGRDLRLIEEALSEGDLQQQEVAVAKLKEFALRGRSNARELLERVVQPRKTDPWRLGPSVRCEAADALVDCSLRRGGGSGSLYVAIAAYKRLLQHDWIYDKDPVNWAKVQTRLGVALNALGSGEGGDTTGNVELMKEAIAALQAALQVRTRIAMPFEWAETQNSLGNVLMRLGEHTGDDAKLVEAVAAYRAALDVRTPDRMPAQWAATQNNLGFVLSHIGEKSANPDWLQEAVAAYRAGLQVATREENPAQWAMAQSNLGLALTRLGKQMRDVTYLQDAIACFRSALEIRTRDDMPTAFAMTQTFLGNVLQISGDWTGNLKQLGEAVDCYNAALTVRTRNERPAQWAMSQFDLGCALLTLSRHSNKSADLEAARAAVANAVAADPHEMNWKATLTEIDEQLRRSKM